MIRLLIKGDMQIACAAVRRRGMEPRKPIISKDGIEVSCSVPNSDHARVVEWFCEEPPSRQPGAGYPFGTLLFYSQDRDIPLEDVK